MRALILLWVVGLMPHGASAQAFHSESGHVEFTSSVPLHDFTGVSDQLVGRISLPDSTVDFYVDLTTLDSGLGKRDRDMRLSLETGRFPFAEFFGKLLVLPDPATEGVQPVRVRGSFKIHGVTREIEVDGTLSMSTQGLTVEAAWALNLKDYDIVPPRLLLIKVDEVQQIRLKALLKPESK